MLQLASLLQQLILQTHSGKHTLLDHIQNLKKREVQVLLSVVA